MPNDPQSNASSGDLEEEPGLEPRPPSGLGKNQKWAATGLVVFGFCIVIFWFVQLRHSIYAPFNSNLSGQAPEANLAEPAEQTAANEALKNKDTDGDGLSDYDELYVYKTSPYLEDSDGDGEKDGAEIKNGTDPNCPLGRTCEPTGILDAGAANGTGDTPVKSDNALGDLLEQYNDLKTENQSDATENTGLNSDQVKMLENIDATTLRKMLLDAGMTQADLDKISDIELMQSYQETLSSETGQ